MSLYIVKNDDGNTMDYNGYFNFPISQTELFDEPNEPAKFAEELGGHVVELVEAPAKVVVSEKEAKMLESAKADKCPITHINNFSEWYGSADQDRLMRAYVNGWTVEKPKRYVLPMPSGNPDEKSMRFAKRLGHQNWQPSNYRHTVGEVSGLASFLVTQSDINMAPDWVKAITPVEVTDDDE